MSRVATTPEADQDLVEIALYTSTSQGSIEAARTFVWMLKDKFMLLAKNPDLGRVRDEITGLRTASTHMLRSFPVNKYVVFYEPMEDGQDLRLAPTCRGKSTIQTTIYERFTALERKS